MNEEELTGRRRYRVQWVRFGFCDKREVVVLQVERKWLRTWYCGTVESEWVTDWRDARITDLTVDPTA